LLLQPERLEALRVLCELLADERDKLAVGRLLRAFDRLRELLCRRCVPLQPIGGELEEEPLLDQ
jgi:hypothetical protein